MSKPAKFVPRSAWGAGPRGATPSSHPIGATLGVTAHWEGPGMGGFAHNVCARKVKTIERFHRGTRGWADIAYNAIVCPHGYVFEGRGVNVMSAANGFTSVNDDWYAVCYLGGTGDPFTDAAREGFREARKWLRSEGRAGAKTNGHRDHKPTACPGDAIYAWVHAGAWVKGSTTDATNEGADDMAGLSDRYPAWHPGDKDSKDTMPLDQQLQQARGYAQEAYRQARAANTRAGRLEKALEALGNGLGAEVGKAVREALADATVDVDVTVTGGDK